VARETVTHLTDDIDGSQAAESLTFSFRGVEYELDLSTKNVAALEKALGKYMAAGRKVRRATSPRAAVPAEADSAVAGIREWALANGYQVSSRGRIPAEVRHAYEDAQG
jgi:hypothetical protein